MGPLVWGGVVPLGPLGQGLLEPSGVTVVGQLKQGLVSIAPIGVQVMVVCFSKLKTTDKKIDGNGFGNINRDKHQVCRGVCERL